MMTREPIRRVPAIFKPRATTTATKNKNIKLILLIGIFRAWASSFEIIPSIRLSEILRITRKIVVTATRTITRSSLVIWVISPKRASRSSGSGVNSNPMAKLSVKNIPTRVSEGSSVFFSTSQIPKIAISRVANAPKNGLKLNNRAMAIPGRATCDKASPTRDMRLKTIKDPTYPAPRPIIDPVISCSNKELSIRV